MVKFFWCSYANKKVSILVLKVETTQVISAKMSYCFTVQSKKKFKTLSSMHKPLHLKSALKPVLIYNF